METVLEFNGAYVDGLGVFSQQIRLPGLASLPQPIPGWPLELYPGTLNVRIGTHGFPEEWASRFEGKTVKALDSGLFKPLAELPASAIEGNLLQPGPTSPHRGCAQIWGATLSKEEAQVECFVLRRIGSGYAQVLEVVASERLSTALNLTLNDAVRLLMRGVWR